MMKDNETVNFNLHDRAVFISGGAGDIGEVIVETFVAQKSKVVIADLDGEKAESLAQKYGSNEVIACRMDLTNEESIQAAIEFAVNHFSHIDILVNVAGILCRKSLFDTSQTDFEDSFGVNVTGLFLVSREAAKRMKNHGSGTIINISSMNSKLAVENRILYSATKAAVNSLTQSMALELAPYGITVNAVAPGIVDSKMARVRLNTPELYKTFTDAIPLKELTQPEDVANCVLFLASPYAKNISGEVVSVDGALTVRMSLPKP